jgi:predicted Zn-dependent protease
MGQAGFDQAGFASMFEKLQKASRLNDFGAYPYLRSHPLTTERLADMASRDFGASRASQADPGDVEHSMVAARARALAQAGVENLRTLAAEADAPRFNALPAVRQAALLYQAALASLRLQDFVRTDAAVGRLRPVVFGDAAGQRLLALLTLEVAHARALAGVLPPEDLAATLRAVPASPGGSAAPRRPELFAQANLLLQAGRAAEVSPMLSLWLASHPRDAAAWQLMAASTRAQGNLLRSIRAEAEARAAHYDYSGALDRFKAAQELLRGSGSNMAGGDHLDASIIDARARQMALLAREQALQR